jgi:hypothetical protein
MVGILKIYGRLTFRLGAKMAEPTYKKFKRVRIYCSIIEG